MREIVEQGSEEGCDDEDLDDVGAACHRENSKPGSVCVRNLAGRELFGTLQRIV
jgi:hypothetical protein